MTIEHRDIDKEKPRTEIRLSVVITFSFRLESFKESFTFVSTTISLANDLCFVSENVFTQCHRQPLSTFLYSFKTP